MNSDQLKAKLKQLRSEIRRKWGQLTDNGMTETAGSMEKLVGRIRERNTRRSAAEPSKRVRELRQDS